MLAGAGSDAMNSGINDADRCNAIVLNTDDPVDNEILAQLRADPRIEFIDNVSQQQAGLQELRPPPPPDVIAEPTRWAYYPWRRAVVPRSGPSRISTVAT